MLTCAQQITLYIFLAIVLTLIFCYVLVCHQVVNMPNLILGKISQRFSNPCDIQFPLVYREAVYIPKTNGVYEQKLAIALTDVAYMTSNANCQEILPIENPPGFSQQLRIEGIEPVSGEKVMLAYIFWNQFSRQVIISFTGTEAKCLWK